MLSNLEGNCYGFATWCRKLHFSSVGCRKSKKVGKHWLKKYFFEIGDEVSSLSYERFYL